MQIRHRARRLRDAVNEFDHAAPVKTFSPISLPRDARLLGGVVGGAEEMQGDVRLVAYDPAIVAGRSGRYVKERAGTEFVDDTIVHRSGGATGKNQPNMLGVAARRSYSWAHVRGPLPSGLVSGAANGHAADVDDLELALFECADFIGSFETLQDCFEQSHGFLTEI